MENFDYIHCKIMPNPGNGDKCVQVRVKEKPGLLNIIVERQIHHRDDHFDRHFNYHTALLIKGYFEGL